MKVLLSVIALLSLSVGFCRAQMWDEERYRSILDSIHEPVFRKDTINITTLGAEAGNEKKLCTEQINSAIMTLSAKGGGVVLIPDGVFHTAGIILKSDVNLHISSGATLKFSSDPDDYLPNVRTRWEGVDCYNYQPFIYAYEVKNIAITGNGIIDGSAGNDNWWYMKGNKKFGYVKGMPSQGKTGRPRLMEFNDEGAPVEDRQFGEGFNLRPQLVNLINSKEILIEGVVFRNSPFWVIHPLFCRNLTVRGIKVISSGPNNDGCDPECCDNVLIEDCEFFTGDDCIAIKSGRNNDGRKAGVPSSNIIVRNCHFAAGHGGVTIGSEISGGFENLFAENCLFDGEDLRHAFRIKSSLIRGGTISNVYVRGFKVLNTSRSCVDIDLMYEPNEKAGTEYEPKLNNILLSGFSVDSCNSFISIVGTGRENSISGIRVKDCTISRSEEKVIIENAPGIEMENVIFK